MTENRDGLHARMASERLRALFAAWKDLAAGRIGPKRGEITPAKLRSTLGWTFVVDVLDGGRDFRVGFRGDRVIQFMGEPCETQNLSELRGIPFFDAAERLFRQCVESGQPVLSEPKGTSYRGKEHLEREVLLVPLSDNGTAVTGILGAFETWRLGTHARAAETDLAGESR